MTTSDDEVARVGWNDPSVLRVLFVTPECYPLIKTGGLADVTGALPLALSEIGIDSRVLLPAYPVVLERALDPLEVAAFELPDGSEARLWSARSTTGLDLYLLDAPELFGRAGNPYLGSDGVDWPDNHLRFAALSWVGSLLAQGQLDWWRADVVHVHDWQTALVPTYLRLAAALGHDVPATVLTIHNLAFQGIFPAAVASVLSLPAAEFTAEGYEYYGKVSFLKAGVVDADEITTVSPTYAREIVSESQGMGFDGVLRSRAGHLTGIVNGIDTAVWDPATDVDLPARYTARSLRGKADNKAALQHELGLDVRGDAPLFCVISRLTTQKGLDLLLEALPSVVDNNAQLAVLGSGDRGLEREFLAAARWWKGQIAVRIGYDETLSHRMQGGADAIIVPSRFEPCGLTQLCGLRYGTLPVVARVGGLADTVIDANEAAVRDGVATGFVFAPVTAEALGGALERAVDLFKEQATWQKIMRRAMRHDVGWTAAAARYEQVYRTALANR